MYLELLHPKRRPSPMNMLDRIARNYFFQPSSFLTDESFNVDLQDLKDQYVLKADMPGINKEDVECAYNDGILTIGISKNITNDDSNDNYRIKERYINCVSRSFDLPNIDENSLNAELKNGVLTVIAKKCSKTNQPNKIKIN